VPELRRAAEPPGGQARDVVRGTGTNDAADTPVELLQALAVLAEPPGDGHAALAAALELPSVPGAADYSEVFLFQLYPYASVHLGPEGMMGGVALDRIAGFWRAVGRTPPPEPDHLSALLGLYVSLAVDEGGTGAAAERSLTGAGRSALLQEHLVPWVFAFLERVQELASGPYAVWAELLSRTLLGEVRREPVPGSLPAHCREAGHMPDPRREGAGAFVTALLAPARSGVTLVRADLARVAAEHGLGLRAGERRYALEHLLGQAPSAVLEALAREAGRQAALHAARAGVLGVAATHAAARAADTAELLRMLAVAETPARG